MRKHWVLITTLALFGCATSPGPEQRPVATWTDQAVITYYDRNHDGRVDYELHDFGCCDRNWALDDSDFNGRYDLEIRWGYAFERRSADSPVAGDVSISPGVPPGSDM